MHTITSMSVSIKSIASIATANVGTNCILTVLSAAITICCTFINVSAATSIGI